MKSLDLDYSTEESSFNQELLLTNMINTFELCHIHITVTDGTGSRILEGGAIMQERL